MSARKLSRREPVQTSSSPRAGIPPARLSLYVAAALCCLTLAVFSAVLTCGYINFDDDLYVYDNPVVAKGITPAGIAYAFTSLSPFYWHPVTWLSHMLDCQIFGLAAGGHHATNLLLHIANVVLLFLLLRRLTGALWPSALAAALFAIHPLRVESVAWIAERKDMLSCLFALLTFRAYADYVEARTKRRYALVLLMFVLALMSKPTAVTLPFALLLLDYWPLGRWSRSGAWALVREKLPLVALSAAAAAATYKGQQLWGAVKSMERFPLDHRIANAALSYVSYLRDIFWPGPLALPYPYATRFDLFPVAIAAAALLAVTVTVVRHARCHYLPFGWFWFVGTLVPMIGLVQVGLQSRADRFTYLPSIGLFVAVAWGAAAIVGRFRISPRVCAATAAAVILVLAARSHAQTGYWRNSATLFEHTLAVTTGNRVAHYNLGYEYMMTRRPADAERQFKAALQVDPKCLACLKNLGNVLHEQGRFGEALLAISEALRIKPDFAPVMADRGLIFKQMGLVDLSLRSYESALANGLPDDQAADVHNHLGAIYMEKGLVSKAADHFGEAVRLAPSLTMARMNFGITLTEMGRDREALAQMEKVLAAQPDYAGAKEKVEQLRIRLGR